MSTEEIALINAEYLAVISLHGEVKELIIACEKIEPNQNANISAIAELRSTLDHIMRTHSVLYGIEDDQSIVEQTGMDAFHYCKSNLDKALGHLYRAGYDAYDIMSISLSGKIRQLLTGRSKEALYHVIPDYLSILDQIENAEKMIISAKVQKDVQGSEVEQKQFSEYSTANTILDQILKKLELVMGRVIQYEEEKEHKKKGEMRFHVILVIVILLLGMLIDHYIIK